MSIEIDISTNALLCWPVEFLPGRMPPRTLHVTAVWIPKVKVTKEHLLDVIRRGTGYSYGSDSYRLADVVGTGAFGPEHNIPVLKVQVGEPYPTQKANADRELTDNQYGLRYLLDNAGIDYAREYKYNPHVTVKLSTALNPPKQVLLRPLELWYKDDEPVEV